MSKVFNMVGGGGGKNISSIIITGLESTDTITCTKDGKSYIATWDDTAQHFEIVGLPLGTFTVTATNGTKTTTETVLIDIAGIYEIKMDYKLWLYKDGDECEDVTGGWVFCPWTSSSYYSKGTMTKDDTSILLLSNAKQFAGARPSNMINLTNYSKIVLVVESRTGTGEYNYSGIEVVQSLSNLDSSAAEAKTMIPIDSTGEVVVDISSVSGNKYIVCFVSSDGGASATLRFSEIYLI